MKTTPRETARRLSPRRPQAAEVLSQMQSLRSKDENYFSFDWMLLFATYAVVVLIFFLFTPYTHQLDEIKNLFLYSLPPFLLAAAAYKVDLRRMNWKTHAPTILLGLLTVQMFFSYLINPYKPVAERVVWFQVACMTFTVVFAWFMNSENKMRKTMMFFVLLSLGSVAVGLFLFAGQGFTDQIYEGMRQSEFWRKYYPEWVTLFYTLKSSKEMYSTILNPDFYAAFLLMMLPLSLAMFFVEEHLGFKVMAVLTFLLMNVCLFFTNSNDSFMSITFITYPLFFLLGYLYVKSWNISKRVLITFFAGAVVLGATVVLLMYPTLARTWDFKAAALSGRKILWMGGVWPWLYRGDPSMHHLNFLTILFGTGPGGYRYYFPVFRSPVFFDNQINNVTTFGHNYYIDMACEFGLVGLLLFLGLYATVFYNAWQQIRSTSNRAHQFYQIACVCGLAGVALQNVFSPNNRWAVCGMIFYSLFGLSMGIYHLDNPGKEVGPEQDPKPVAQRLAGWAPAVLVMMFAWQMLPEGARNLGLDMIPGVDADLASFVRNLLLFGGLVFFLRTSLWGDSVDVMVRRKNAEPESAPAFSMKLSRWALAALVVVFAIRSVPQGWNWFKGAIDNADGLHYMEMAEQVDGAQKDEFLQKSIQEFESAVAYNPTFVTSYYKLAHVYNQVGRIDDALKAYETLDYYNPHYSEIHLNLGIMYSTKASSGSESERLKYMEKSYSEMKEAARQEWKPNVQWIAGMIAQELATLYQAEGSKEQAAGNKDKAEHSKQQAQQVFDEAKTYYKRLVDYKPLLPQEAADRKEKYVKAQKELIQLAYITGKLSEAEDVLIQMYRDDPDNSEYLSTLMAFYDAQGKDKEKAKFLESAVHGDPLDVRLRARLAEAYADLNEQASYQHELSRIEILEPHNRTAVAGLFLSYKKTGQEQKAADYAKKLRALGVDSEKLSNDTLKEKDSTGTLRELEKKLTSAAYVLPPPGAAPTSASAPSAAASAATTATPAVTAQTASATTAASAEKAPVPVAAAKSTSVPDEKTSQ